jgi:cell division FtsZ-interacting protein ZapD
MDLLASVVVPLISIAVGAGVTYWLNVRTRRSMRFEDLINAAIAAVAVEEASRSAITRVVADQLDPANRAELQTAVIRQPSRTTTSRTWRPGRRSPA